MRWRDKLILLRKKTAMDAISKSTSTHYVSSTQDINNSTLEEDENHATQLGAFSHQFPNGRDASATGFSISSASVTSKKSLDRIVSLQEKPERASAHIRLNPDQCPLRSSNIGACSIQTAVSVPNRPGKRIKPAQCLKIDGIYVDGKRIWHEIIDYLERAGVQDQYMPSLKAALEEIAQIGEGEFDYYEDIADQLIEKISAQNGDVFQLTPRTTALTSSGFGESIPVRLLLTALMLSSALTKTEARRTPRYGPPKEHETCPAPIPAKPLQFSPPADAQTYPNRGWLKDWIKLILTGNGRLTYPLDPRVIPGVEFTGPDTQLKDGYYAFAYRTLDLEIAIYYTGSDPHTNNGVAHSYMASGAPVICAGMAHARNGLFDYLNVDSGHTHPDPIVYLDENCEEQVTSGVSLDYTEQRLRDQGLAAPIVTKSPFRSYDLKDQRASCESTRASSSHAQKNRV